MTDVDSSITRSITVMIAVSVTTVLLLLSACGPARVERPRDGAPVGSEARPTNVVTAGGPPPTLVPAGSPSGSVFAGPSPTPSPSPVAGFVIVATDGQGANMRVSPSTSAAIITTLREGTPVAVIGEPVQAEGRAWRQIQSGNQIGWVVAVVVRPR